MNPPIAVLGITILSTQPGLLVVAEEQRVDRQLLNALPLVGELSGRSYWNVERTSGNAIRP